VLVFFTVVDGAPIIIVLVFVVPIDNCEPGTDESI
jgi:hypothetical protein